MSSERAPVRALILAGGSGTRLWPRSTDAHPKPFLKLAGTTSLLKDAHRRAVALAGEEGVYVSARKAHEEHVEAELPDVPPDHIVLEPERRNTAPAIALAALVVADEAADAVLAVLPSDQAVRDDAAFLHALHAGVHAARAGDRLVTIGIPPTRAETGFGYMEIGETAEPFVRPVKRFVEKPGAADAERYLASGLFLWNAGIFLFRVSVLIGEMERLCPDILHAARRAHEARRRGDGEAFDRAFSSAPSVSIDYAVMENAREVVTVPCVCGWSDLGSWDAVYEFRGGSSGVNVLEGPAEVRDGLANLVLAEEKPVRVVGLSDIVVVDAPEGILVMKRGASDALRKSVEDSLAAPSPAKVRA